VMRASMSVPVALHHRNGGKLLVDGMLVNNLPINVARAMGADIIIAVNVGTPFDETQRAGFDSSVAAARCSVS